MKIDRLIGIIMVLQQKGKVTAPYLAEKFEVSRRTINRDIEDICRAGIPIVTTQGAEGGIAIMDGYQLDTAILTEEELQAIFAGLKSLDSVSAYPKTALLSEKLCGRKNVIPVEEHITIDLSSFYKGSLSEKIELLKSAIQQRKQVKFHYYYNKGEADKQIEPCLIVFRWSAWYVFGFCTERRDFRMYKLNRLWDLELTGVNFEPREIPPERMNFGSNMTDDIIIAAIYEESVKYRLVEEYGPYCFTVLEDGRLYSELGFSSYGDAVRWFLSFGAQVRILSPDDFKELFLAETEKILLRYQEL